MTDATTTAMRRPAGKPTDRALKRGEREHQEQLDPNTPRRPRQPDDQRFELQPPPLPALRSRQLVDDVHD